MKGDTCLDPGVSQKLTTTEIKDGVTPNSSF